ncbi:MAG TPA: 50S ribosomal protein L9 [Bacteroidales bacterium]|nr:50S ribosomal protein L9 [Bacteroidales bacterium]HPS17997.1 50S ribosomal protein L9 [Bacteroidales bacterium]
MEVILKQDIHNLGYKNDVVKVKEGYARNFLIPKNMATVATETNRKILAENMKQRAFKEEKIKKEAQKVAETLGSITLKIGAKAGTSGKIFGAVNALQIAEAIQKQFNVEIDRKKIHVDGESIKELGTYSAKVILHKEVKLDVKFEVVAE